MSAISSVTKNLAFSCAMVGSLKSVANDSVGIASKSAIKSGVLDNVSTSRSFGTLNCILSRIEHAKYLKSTREIKGLISEY